MNQPVVTDVNEDVKYFFVFYGGAPSIAMARVAYRTVGRVPPRLRHERKVLNCPHCTLPFTDASKETKVELYKYPAQSHVQCQLYPQCPNCGKEVGIFVVS
jgi:hypothetical protein